MKALRAMVSDCEIIGFASTHRVCENVVMRRKQPPRVEEARTPRETARASAGPSKAGSIPARRGRGRPRRNAERFFVPRRTKVRPGRNTQSVCWSGGAVHRSGAWSSERDRCVGRGSVRVCRAGVLAGWVVPARGLLSLVGGHGAGDTAQYRPPTGRPGKYRRRFGRASLLGRGGHGVLWRAREV